MGSYALERSIEVSAPADKVWDRLLDINSWPAWKSFIPKVSWGGGEVQVGSKFTMNIKVKGPALPVPVRVIELDRPGRMAWTGGLPGLSMSVHSFILEEKGATTLVKSREEFSGALVGLMLVFVTANDLDNLHDNWLEAIKKEVEKPT